MNNIFLKLFIRIIMEIVHLQRRCSSHLLLLYFVIVVIQ